MPLAPVSAIPPLPELPELPEGWGTEWGTEQNGELNSGHVIPFVYSDNNKKSLHFSIHQLQSKMSVGKPDELEVDYTKTMMGFLVLRRKPRHIAMIGLGGGSLAKFCYRNLPQTKITVVEINPHVIKLRDQFLVPADDDRFKVLEADGADFVRDAEPDVDVLLVDGFDHQGQPEQLCSQAFYDHCHRLLTDQAVMAVNLHNDHPLFGVFVDRINRSFESNTAEVAANRDGNVIIFAGKGIAVSAHLLRTNIQLAHAVWNDPLVRNDRLF
jgi:spermidine synthase